MECEQEPSAVGPEGSAKPGLGQPATWKQGGPGTRQHGGGRLAGWKETT